MVHVRERAQHVSPASGSRLSCSICNRTFEHEASAKRHYYYCRSRLADTGQSRKRSCAACVRAKVRCMWPGDVGLGACIRCSKRNATCEYDVAGKGSKASFESSEGYAPATSAAESRDADMQSAINRVSLVSTKSRRHQDDVALFDALDPRDLDLGTVTEWSFLDSLDSTISDLGLDTEYILRQKPSSMSLACSKIIALPNVKKSPPDPWSDQLLSPTPLFSTHAFTRPDHVALVSLALRILRSYPSMMLAPGAVPPFMHTSILSSARSDDSRKISTSNSSLIRSFKSQNASGKRSWVWGQIWYEQERILAQYSNFDRWELLEALQTLLIFCLLRVQDAPAGSAAFDVSLLTTVTLVSQALDASVGECFDDVLPEDPALAVKDWIFLESRSRTVLIFQILGLLVDISIAVSYVAPGGMVLVPLPSSTTLWNTRDFERWKPEYKKWRKQCTVYAVSETGDLVRIQNVDDGLLSSPAEWEGWSAEVGELSALVMIIGDLLRTSSNG